MARHHPGPDTVLIALGMHWRPPEDPTGGCLRWGRTTIRKPHMYSFRAPSLAAQGKYYARLICEFPTLRPRTLIRSCRPPQAPLWSASRCECAPHVQHCEFPCFTDASDVLVARLPLSQPAFWRERLNLTHRSTISLRAIPLCDRSINVCDER